MTELNRRAMLGATAAALAGASSPAFAAWPEAGHGMPMEGPDTPHICLGPIADSEINPAGIRRYTQIGLTHIIVNGSGYPWDAGMLKTKVKTLADNGLVAGDIGLPWTGAAGGGMRDIIYARPGRDKAIEDVKTSIRAASAAGIPIVEYNFYAHRLEEGYFDEPDPSRGNAGVESFYYDRVKDLPPLPEEGAHTLDEIWANCEYFLKAVVPVAEENHVRLALHPNDPPAPISRGSQQIMSTLDGWKKLVGLVNSPSNCIIFDCGVTRELGENPVEVANWFGSRDRIGHVHWRNVRLRVPRQNYTEVTPDNGDNNMLAVMKALVKVGYRYMIFPEHARGLDVDRDLKTNNAAQWAYHVGYARAMLQTALMER
ncbi:MAG TPA: mannonate dehydratase [Rhizomicrobium sp.]|jgi:mannonate dehydratase|nr:mannonate dehydratase [Rhizomicrobium sp.]